MDIQDYEKAIYDFTKVLEIDRGKAYLHVPFGKHAGSGYAAYLAARIEREAQAATDEQVRKNLATKELAWLRRGAPARSTKPKARVDAAKAIVHIATSGLGGIWHVTNQGVVSWYEFAREVLLTAGMDAAKVKPISTSDLQPPRPAQRPANSVLHNGRMITEGIALLPDFREPLARLVRRLLAETGE